MCALFSVLAAFAAVVLAGPASATAAPAAVDEYDLALPPDDGPQEPAPAPEPEPEPAPPVAPTDPTVPVAPTGEPVPYEAASEAAPEPERKLDVAAARRDVLFEAPAEPPAREARTLAAPAEDSSLPPMLWVLFGLGGACIVATLVRLRRFAAALGASRPAVPSSQISS